MIIVQENSTRMLVEQVNECTANIIITSPVVISGGGGNVDSVNNVLPDANKNVTIDIGDIATLQDQLNAKITKVVSKLNFDGQNILLNCPENVYNVYKLSAAITCAITPNEITKGAVLFLQGNGSALHIPTFTNAEQDGDEQFITTNNYVNPVIFWYRGDKVIYRIMSGYVMDNEAMTLSSVSISAITQIAATFNYVADKISSIVWGVYSAPESQPAKSEILAGTNASDFGTKVVSGAGVGTIAIDTLTYLTEYTIFYYTISENSIESDVAFTNFQTIDLTAMPAPVLSITALDAYSLRATLNQNINGVDLYRGATTGGETFLKTLSAGILTDDTTGLQPNDTRFFIALAKGDGITTKDSIMSTEYSGTTSELPRLATPVVTATPNGQTQIDTSCVQITGNNGYNVYGSDTQNGTFVLLNVNTTNDNTYSETGLTAGQTRWYKYEAISNPATNRNSLLSVAVSAATISVVTPATLAFEYDFDSLDILGTGTNPPLNSNLTTWLNKGTRGLSAIPVTGTNKVVVRSNNIELLNSGYLTYSDIQFSQPFTLFFIVRYKALNANYDIITTNSFDASRAFMRKSSTNFHQMFGGTLVSDTQAVVLNKDYIVQAVFDGASSKIRVNNNSWVNTNPGTGGWASADWVIGASPTFINILNGYIYSIGLKIGVVSDANINSLVAYYVSKYNLTL